VQYDQAYDPQYIEDPNGAAAGASTSAAPQAESPDKTRGRKRTRTQVGLNYILMVYLFIDELVRLSLLHLLQAW
jgi:hypothetical protein